jgi:hypothetical protein
MVAFRVIQSLFVPLSFPTSMFPCAVLHEIVKFRVVVCYVVQLSGLAPYCPSSSGANCSHFLDHASCGRDVTHPPHL